MTKRLKWAIFFAGIAAWGCAGGKKAARSADFDASNISGPRNASEKMVEFDLNQDGLPDVWNYLTPATTADGQQTFRLVRKEFDINWDRKIDIVRYYGANEQVVREAYDLDFDGKVDQVSIFEKNVLIRKERDLNYDGMNDLWVYYEKGQIARKERDTNYDGKVDYWEYWDGDAIDRIGEDVDGDGQVDRWTKNPQTSES